MIKTLTISMLLVIIFLSPGCSLNGINEKDLLSEENLSDKNKDDNNLDVVDDIVVDNEIFDGSGVADGGLIALQKGTVAPFFELGRVGGGNVSFDDFCGVPLILLFWERDCHVCLIALKALEDIYRVDEEIKIFVVTQNAGDDLESYLEEQDITIPFLIDSEGVVFEDYKISITPTAVAIDRAGNVELVISGFLNHESAKTMQRLLRKWVIDRVII